jgi:hypothetical protein
MNVFIPFLLNVIGFKVILAGCGCGLKSAILKGADDVYGGIGINEG